MGLTTAMYTGLSGLNVNQSRIETIGHNIANVNTTAYRGSRTLFQTQFSHILSMGTPPGDESGGTNPMQVGHGAIVGTTHRTSGPGSVETTGLVGDMAIEGAGYFVVRDSSGRDYYTRDGAFNLDANNQLVATNGMLVRGYGVDSDFNIVPGTVQNLTIPIGMQTIAKATGSVDFEGDLSALETVASAGAVVSSQAMVDGGGAAAVMGTALTDLRSATAPGVALFTAGDTIRISGITKGGRTTSTAEFTVGTDGNTLGDFASWLETQLGIQTGAGMAGNPGVIVDGGALVVHSNAGEELAISIDNNDVLSSSAGVPVPFSFTQTSPAVGTGVYTSFTVYDSLGTPAQVNATFVLESMPATGPVWRYYLESADGGSARSLGTGTVNFDVNGQYVSSTGNQFSLDRSGSGAASPLTFSIDFSEVNGLSTRTSEVILGTQDGYPPGTLTSFGVEDDGTIVGVFTNGLTQDLGQVVLAKFANETGLVAESENLFSVGPNSGDAAIVTAGAAGMGTIRSGALEMSNVDLAQEFIGLITSSTAYQAASRVISTSNDMLDQLLMTLR